MKKSVYFIIAITISALLIITLCICNNIFSKNIKKTKEIKLSTINSNDNKFKISIPSDVKYSINKDKDNYNINIYCTDLQMFIYGSTLENSTAKPLIDIVDLDQADFIAKKENVQIIHNTSELKINNYNAYTYCFTYTDPDYANDFFSQVVWIKNNNLFYILNIEIALENYENNKDLINSIINSFAEI